MQDRRALIRCNAGHATGFGHVSRCLAIAKELCDKGMHVRFALGSNEAVPRVNERGLVARVLSGDDADRAFVGIVADWKPEVLILDVRPPHSVECLRRIREVVPTIVTIDDISHQRLFADHVFLPPTPTVQGLEWPGFKGQTHIGIEWMPLGDTFTPCPPNPWDGQGSLHLLMTMGGSDPWGYTRLLAPILAPLCKEHGVQLGIVIGPGFVDREQQLAECAGLAGQPKIFYMPPHMGDVYAWCHAAITVFGVSAYELAACGRPALYICPDADYEEHAGVFVELQLGEVLLFLASCVSVDAVEGAVRWFKNAASGGVGKRQKHEGITLASHRIAEVIYE